VSVAIKQYFSESLVSTLTEKIVLYYLIFTFFLSLTFFSSSAKNNVTLKKSSNIISQTNDKQNNVKFKNEKTSELEKEKEEEKQENIAHDNNEKKNKKNKNKQKDKQLLKKKTRDLREKIMSEGLKGLKFSSVHLPENNVKMEEVVENGNSPVSSIDSKLSQKRNREETREKNGKFKKRKTNRV